MLVETVDSEKLAKKLNSAVEKAQRDRLAVLVQVHTSQSEGTKFGLDIEQVPDLVNFINTQCPHLKFQGLMSMGKLYDREGFRQIAELRTLLLEKFE